MDDLQWIKDVEFFHDIENYVGKPLKLTDHYRIDQFGYRIERTEESPEAYNICWDEVIKDNEGAEMVHKVCTRFRSSTIIQMFESGQIKLDIKRMDESDDLDWVKDSYHTLRQLASIPDGIQTGDILTLVGGITMSKRSDRVVLNKMDIEILSVPTIGEYRITNPGLKFMPLKLSDYNTLNDSSYGHTMWPELKENGKNALYFIENDGNLLVTKLKRN